MIKPNIIISKCINFDECRFNWWIIKEPFLESLWKYVNYIPVCPEVAIWLSTPRLPLRIFRSHEWLRLYQPATEIDLTDKMNKFSQNFLKSQENIDWFILKNKSPSCWIRDVKVYNKIDSHVSTERDWVWTFTSNIDDFFLHIPKEDEWRLKNFRLREEFLTKIFCLADFREIKNKLVISELSDFQAKNKYLFMFYSPKIQKELWQIIASYNKSNIDDIYESYYLKLLELFQTETKIWKMINSLTHIF